MKTSNMLVDQSGPVNILPNGIKPENSNFTTVCSVAIVPEMAKDSSLSSIRKLPKKRKFDLSELEEPECAKRDSVESTPPTTHRATNITPPQSTAVDYSCVGNSAGGSNVSENAGDNGSIRGRYSAGHNSDSSPPKLTPQKMESPPVYYQEGASSKGSSMLEYYKPNSNFSVPSLNVSGASERSNETCEKLNIALHEWIDHRVLAKRSGVYIPGTIRKADSTYGNVWVEFDNNGEELILFADVLQNGRYDVISDASPTLMQVTVGARVCVRTSGSLVDDKQGLSRLFVEAIVHKIITSPVQFVVRLLGPESKEYVVKRADIRLLQPPWSDELENDYEHELPPPLLPYGNIPPSSVNRASNIMPSSNAYLQTPSNQLDPASKSLCRSAATSPLRVTPVAGNAGCAAAALGSGGVDERSRRFDEYCESDDDLRKENILFSSMEAG